MPLQPSGHGRVRPNGIAIHYECFGRPEDPAVLLIVGMDEHCTAWGPQFYEPLVRAGTYVVRFDNRDCGLSEWIWDWDEARPYTLDDMAGDALGLLDTLGISRAHLVGASMGGMIAQRMALRCPGRTRTLTLIATSAFPFDPDPELRPAVDPTRLHRLHEELVTRYPNRLTDPSEAIEYRLAVMKALAGTRFPFDEAPARELITRNVTERRGYNPSAQAHQLAAVIASGSWLEELSRIRVPVLVLHGTEDPLVPPGHAVKCASRIPGARLVWMEGVGHELPPGILDLVVREILALFRRERPLETLPPRHKVDGGPALRPERGGNERAVMNRNSQVGRW